MGRSVKFYAAAMAAAGCATLCVGSPAGAAQNPVADLRVHTTTQYVRPGTSPWVMRIVFHDNGPDTSSAYTWTIELPPGIESHPERNSDCQVTPDRSKISCRREGKAPDDQGYDGEVSVWVNDCKMTAGMEAEARVSVVSDNPAEDPNPANNQATFKFIVQ